jgi:hypothetical protein
MRPSRSRPGTGAGCNRPCLSAAPASQIIERVREFDRMSNPRELIGLIASSRTHLRQRV